MSSIDTVFTSFDAEMMARAFSLARKGQYSTTPNPQVGCVIIDANRQIVGEGFHQKAGEGHAEANALSQAGAKSKGSTVYVTLEPCAHFGNTPPCALSLINAKVKKVIVACADPNPSVNGSGVAMLIEAGIKVSVGLMKETALKLNKAFFARMHNNRPLITVKLAASLDGKTALTSGESQWITSAQSRADVQRYRAGACAILSGADTIIADNPRLNVRPGELSESVSEQFAWRGKQPLRVVIDSQNRLSQEAYQMFNDGQASIVYNVSHNPNLSTSENCHVSQQQVAGILLSGKTYVDLQLVVEDLAKKGINQLWVEAGATLSGALFDLGLVDQLVLYQAPKILGDSARGLINATAKKRLREAFNGTIVSVDKIGPDIKTVIQLSHQQTVGN